VEQLALAVQLGEDVAGHHGQLGTGVPEAGEQRPDVPQRPQPVEVPVDPGGEQRLLRPEVMVDAARARGQPGRGLDLGHARPPEALLAEQPHRGVQDAVAGGARG
jgi:hypothetical protein